MENVQSSIATQALVIVLFLYMVGEFFRAIKSAHAALMFTQYRCLRARTLRDCRQLELFVELERFVISVQEVSL